MGEMDKVDKKVHLCFVKLAPAENIMDRKKNLLA